MARAKTYKPAKIIRPFGRDIPELIEKHAEFFFIQNGDVSLRVMLATAPAEDPRGTVILHPGRTEFIEKYFETIEDFMSRGFTVLAIDPRGQGLSDRLLPDRLKSYVRTFQDYAEDVAFVVDELGTRLPKPHILFGHSMGGCVVLQTIISGLMNPSAVVCSAPMLGLFDIQTPLARAIVKTLNLFGMRQKNLPFQKQERGMPVDYKGNKLTSDHHRFQRWAEYFESTPELRVAGPTLGWLEAALQSMAYVNRNAAQLKIPGLIVAAGGDPIVEPASNERFAQAAELDYRVVPGALHEVLMEKDEYRGQFFDAFDAFLIKQAL